MRSSTLRFTLPAMLAGISLAAKAQAPLGGVVTEVTDNRTTSVNSACIVSIALLGDAATDANSVRSVRITKAIDGADRSLLLAAGNGVIPAPFGAEARNGSLKAQVRLRNPSRSSTVIKDIEGEAELFIPTAANGGIVTIAGIALHPAEPVANDTLKKYGITVMYLTKESYEAKKNELDAQMQNDIPGGRLSGLGMIFRNPFSGGLGPDQRFVVALYQNDPDKHIVGMELQDAGGAPLRAGGTWGSGNLKQISLFAAPPADAQLVIYVATPESLKTYPFKLENVPLP